MSRKPIIIHVVGARPNFMKVAPVMRALAADSASMQQFLVHTGQHYSAAMSQVFFDELELPRPDFNLEVGSGTHAAQTADIMRKFEPVLDAMRPDWILVPGDVNSTLACALVASKKGIKVAHLEAGLRSFDRAMPEEVNRVLCDHLADLLLTPSVDADQNLVREGIPAQRIALVGNVMIDTLVRLESKAAMRWGNGLQTKIGGRPYVLVTLHRPANVDNPAMMERILAALGEIGDQIQVVFPVHPRTRAILEQVGTHRAQATGVHLWDPLGYLDFLALQTHAALVVTDSGGIQEETTYLRVPCLTFRPNTERPITVTLGTNQVIGNDPATLGEAVRRALGSSRAERPLPERWDGHAGARVREALLARLI